MNTWTKLNCSEKVSWWHSIIMLNLEDRSFSTAYKSSVLKYVLWWYILKNYVHVALRIHCQVYIMYPFCPSRMTLSSSPSLVLIHLMPCSCGSIINGHRSALVKMVAFSIDMRSLGRFSLFHRAIVAPSVSRERTSKPCVIGMGTCWNEPEYNL